MDGHSKCWTANTSVLLKHEKQIFQSIIRLASVAKGQYFSRVAEITDKKMLYFCQEVAFNELKTYSVIVQTSPNPKFRARSGDPD